MKKSLTRRFEITIAFITISLMVPGFYLFGQITNQQGTTNKEASQSAWAKCLPTDTKPNDVVEGSMAGSAIGQHKVTVESKLNELKATCNRDNKLVDASGTQIVFYHRIGCWGNPPADYRALLQKQEQEINKLKQEFTVIEMSCNPSGSAIQ
ncbi:MAG TPA: hypothetical protein VJ721_03060 [Chthoniobacterales bacterium]|nr:hypothetical protein [Chthoniobacterales bacterium]